MAEHTSLESVHRPRQDPISPRRRIVAVAVGNSIAVYDFLIYTFFAAQIGRAFFPSADPAGSLLASLAAFGAGFAARPLGAILIGRIGDRRGRTTAMQLSFLLMGVSMIGMAVTPTYSVIGAAAPTLVLLFRLIQGFAFGGQIGPSTAYLLEAAPPHRRGLYVSVQYMSQDVAILAAGTIGFALVSLLPEAALDSWGWRVPVLLGAAILPIGYHLRRTLPDTLADATPADAGEGRTGAKRVAALGLVILAAGAVITYLQIYIAVHASPALGVPARQAFLATITIGVCGFALSPVGGWLSDRYGRRPVTIGALLVLLLVAFPGYRLVATTGAPGMLVGWIGLVACCAALAITSALTSITEALAPSFRSTGTGLIYAVAVAVFGGSTQFAAAWLTLVTGSPLAPGWYMMGATAAALAAMLLMPETAPIARSHAVR